MFLHEYSYFAQLDRFIPIFEAPEAADIIVDGILREQSNVYVPSSLWTTDIMNAYVYSPQINSNFNTTIRF